MSFMARSLWRLLRHPPARCNHNQRKMLQFCPVTPFSVYPSFKRSLSTRARAVIPPDYSEADMEIVNAIKLLIDKRIAPVVRQDGGEVSFISYDPETGYVYVRLSGACVGCAQSDITLKHMIQGTLCHYLDEVTAVLNCDEEGYVILSGIEEDSEY